MKRAVTLVFFFGLFLLLFVSNSKQLEINIGFFLNGAPAETSYLLLNARNNFTMVITINMDAKCLIKLVSFSKSIVVKPNTTIAMTQKGVNQVTFWLIPTSVPPDNRVSINYHLACNSTSILQKSFFSANGWVVMNVTDKT